MGKGQKPNNNQNKRRSPNYFKMNEQQFGPDFMKRKTALDIQKDAKKIFIDMTFANIDLEKDVYYFLDPNFLHSLLQVAKDNYEYHAFTLAGMQQLIMQSGANQIESAFIAVMDRHRFVAEAYMIIISHITNILNNQGAKINLCNLVNALQLYRGAFSDMFIVRDDDARRRERRTF